MPAAASSKRSILAFENRPLESDGAGNTESADFEEVFRVHGQAIARLGGETVLQSRLAHRQPVTIALRSSPQLREVREDWRIRDVNSGTIYFIKSITNPDGRNREIEFLCETGSGATS